jgi:hypothetical protein
VKTLFGVLVHVKGSIKTLNNILQTVPLIQSNGKEMKMVYSLNID